MIAVLPSMSAIVRTLVAGNHLFDNPPDGAHHDYFAAGKETTR
jgi:hypothetical protein